MVADAPRKTRQEVLRDFRTDQIVEAAREVFGEVGYAEASMEQIAEAAGVARSTLYVYFPSKDEILSRCFAEGRRYLADRIESAVGMAHGTEARLTAFIAAALGHVDENRSFYRAVMAASANPPNGDVAGEVELLGMERDSNEALIAILQAGIAAGELRKHDAARSATLLGMMIQGSLSGRARHDVDEPAERLAAEMAGFFLHGLEIRSR